MARTSQKSNKTKRNTGSSASMVGKVKSDFPKDTLEKALRVPAAMEETNGGKPLPPTDIAIALSLSPGSSDFQILLASSARYGITGGGAKSERVTLEELGARIVAPVSPEDRSGALVAAALAPATFRSMYDYFKAKKLPEMTFFENTVVREFGVPRSHATKCVRIFVANLEFVGLIKNASTGKWVGGEAVIPATANSEPRDGEHDPTDSGSEQHKRDPATPEVARLSSEKSLPDNRRVFVTHGKNKTLVPQLKELLSFGQFEPVVSVERESVSKPVPDKVMDDMRSCSAAIIHVDAEREVMTAEGQREIALNDNVLIEIGAAMALYGRRFILLVQKSVRLPSNLQGLYEVRYEGERLDGEATLKLLKAFNDFKTYPPLKP